MATTAADDSAHGKPVFDDKLTEDMTPKDHRRDEEIAATIKEDQFVLGSGITVLPMTVGIARGKLEGITTILSEAHTCTGRLPVCLLTYDRCSPLRRIMVSGEVFCATFRNPKGHQRGAGLACFLHAGVLCPPLSESSLKQEAYISLSAKTRQLFAQATYLQDRTC